MFRWGGRGRDFLKTTIAKLYFKTNSIKFANFPENLPSVSFNDHLQIHVQLLQEYIYMKFVNFRTLKQIFFFKKYYKSDFITKSWKYNGNAHSLNNGKFVKNIFLTIQIILFAFS